MSLCCQPSEHRSSGTGLLHVQPFTYTSTNIADVFTAYIVQSSRVPRTPGCLVRSRRVLLLLYDPEEGCDALGRTGRSIRHVQKVSLS